MVSTLGMISFKTNVAYKCVIYYHARYNPALTVSPLVISTVSVVSYVRGSTIQFGVTQDILLLPVTMEYQYLT